MSRNRSDRRGDNDVDRRRQEDVDRDDREPPKKKNKGEGDMNLLTKTGGAYIPPARLRMMQQQITDKSSEQYQRISWEALKKSINGLINKVNVSNISLIVRELFQENIVRGRGVLAQAIIQAQNASPTFTKVYAALVAIINTRFPQNGELILRRLALQFRRSYRRNRKEICLHSAQFIAHLMNQQVAHEIIGLQILTLLLENPTDDSVEVAVGFLKECGQKLMEVSPRGLAAVMERLRNILHEQELDKRVQYMIEAIYTLCVLIADACQTLMNQKGVMFAIRKDGFKEHPAVEANLDLVEETDQFTHMLQLDDDGGGKGTENQLNVFAVDPEFIQNEENYKQIKKDILDESSEGSSSGSGSSSDDSSDDEAENEEEQQTIEDKTETNLVALRRTIYLTIQSSLDFEECAHKLLKMEFEEKDYKEICAMIIDCCSQQRTYEKFFGLLGARFCILKREFMEHFEILFAEQYDIIHRLETNKLRNVAKFFAHLLHSDALPWTVLQNINLSEETTTSSSRIFIKILFQELVEYLGIQKLNQRLKDETLAPFFEGLFPKDSPKNTRFAINFFTSIGLGGLTDELREHLKTAAQQMTEKMQAEQLQSIALSSSDSSDSESSSEEERRKKKKKRRSKKKSEKKRSTKSKKSRKKSAKSSTDSSDSSDSEHSPKKARPKKSKKKAKEQEPSFTSESDSMPERKMKSTVVNGSMQKSATKDEAKEKREQEKEVRRSKRAMSSDSSSDSDSGKEKAEKRKQLKDKLLKFSNTVPNEYYQKDTGKQDKESNKKPKKTEQLKRTSESSSSDSSDSSSDSEDRRQKQKRQSPPRSPAHKREHDKPRRREEERARDYDRKSRGSRGRHHRDRSLSNGR